MMILKKFQHSNSTTKGKTHHHVQICLMSRLELILIFVLQFEAGIRGELVLYNSPGHDVTLPCGNASVSDTTCSSIYWFFDRESSQTLVEVTGGKIWRISARADRLRLGSNCSLVINNITAEDAGRYTCRQRENTDREMITHLNVLTIAPFPPEADPEKDGEVTLVCSLFKYWDIGNCPHCCHQKIIHWVDETRTVLDGEGVGYKFLGQNNCASFLTVKRQRGNNRRYTCQIIDKDNNVKVETHYTAVFKDDKRDDQPGNSNPGSTDWPLSSIMLALRITGLILMTVITVRVIRYGMKTKSCGDDNNVQKHDDEVFYENVEAGPATVRLH